MCGQDGWAKLMGSDLAHHSASVYGPDVVAALPHAGLARNPLCSTGWSLGLTLGNVGLSLPDQVRVPGHALSIRTCPGEVCTRTSRRRSSTALNRRGALRRPAAADENKQHQTSQNPHHHSLRLPKPSQLSPFPASSPAGPEMESYRLDLRLISR